MMFKNRTQAGLLLAEKLKSYHNHANAIIVAIPRGGIPVGYAMAKHMHLPLDIVLSKKIGHPLHQEYAIGAVTLNDRILSNHADTASADYLDAETNRIRALLKQRHDMYYGKNKPLSLKNKIIILVDDGVATGYTLLSSIKLIENQNPSQIIVALPVGPPSAIKKIEAMPAVSNVVCLATPNNFFAVGQFYEEFNQVTDKEVVNLMREAKSFLTASH